MTGLVLGVLYAYLNYASWTKRLLCVLAAVLIPVLANGVRVYITIAVAYLTDMRFGPGVEHVTFAQVFFIVVLLGMFWLGRRWQDDPPSQPTENTTEPSSHRPAPAKWVAVVLALSIMIGTPWYYTVAAERMQANLVDVSTAVLLPTGAAKWLGPIAGQVGWRPAYRGGLVERQGTYRRGDLPPVDVFVAVYAPGAISGTEMISYENVLYAEEHVSLAKVERRRIELPEGGVLGVREVIVPDAGADRLVWHWYVYGDRPLTSGFEIKLLEATSWLTRDARLERIVTLATAYDDAAQDRLRSFLDAHARCVASGFAFEACAE
jgi:EpsI family protein